MHAEREERWILGLFFLTDMWCYGLALVLASFTVLQNLPYLDLMGLHRDRLGCLIIFGVFAVIAGAYDNHRVTDRFDSVYYALLALGAALLVELAAFTVIPEELRVISRREIIAAIPIAAVLLVLWRGLAASWITRFRSLHRRFYVAGDRDEAGRIVQVIQTDERKADAVYVSWDGLKSKCKHWASHGRNHGRIPEDLVIVVHTQNRAQLSDIVLLGGKHFQRMYLYPTFDDLMLFDHGRMTAIAGIPLVEVAGLGQPNPYAYLKRIIDVVIAATGLILALPICVTAAFLVFVTSPGGIFYRQERLGRNGEPFKIIKFRSMAAHIQAKNEAGHVLAGINDARITPVGRFIRKHRIDEIPQLWNVLRGDMSLIGPRPVWKEFYDANRNELPLVDMRLLVRPGLTSLSHVLGSYTSDPRDRLRYDLVYINTLSLLTDLRILFQTVRIVLSGKGAL
ncbi:MAG: exopolysaccharide biosynthesis polyprenyl glycosylphosphotransferase [Candidatus Hydrogenedentes bacterium]|nr:exopolysaccharide biosynthesis polyprenyl glycosylphosphotransferase [Candidatus Hydrogenedentota bacterium]